MSLDVINLLNMGIISAFFESQPGPENLLIHCKTCAAACAVANI